MTPYSFVLNARLPGASLSASQVLRQIRAAGNETVENVEGGPHVFRIGFSGEGDGEEAEWSALCDLGAVFPGAVLVLEDGR